VGNNPISLLKTEELLCLANCLQVAGRCDWRDDARFINRMSVARRFVKALELTVDKELDTRPDGFDDPEPWSLSPSLSDMSIDVVSMLSTKELRCFSNCIEAALECYDNDSEFHTLTGVTMEFARVFKTALEMELTKRQDRPAA